MRDTDTVILFPLSGVSFLVSLLVSEPVVKRATNLEIKQVIAGWISCFLGLLGANYSCCPCLQPGSSL